MEKTLPVSRTTASAIICNGLMVVTMVISARLAEQTMVVSNRMKKYLIIGVFRIDSAISGVARCKGMFDINAMIYHCPACSYAVRTLGPENTKTRKLQYPLNRFQGRHE